MKHFIFGHVLSHNYINTMVQLKKKKTRTKLLDHISVYRLHVSDLSSAKSGRDPQKVFRILGDSLILQNIGVMSSEFITES